MRIRLMVVAAIALSFFTRDGLLAQVPGAGGGNIAFLRIFDQHKSFSATADMRIADAGQKDSMTISFDLAMVEGKVRFEVDLANAKGSMISPEIIAQAKATGMDRAVSILRLDQKRLYLIYPRLKAYANVPMQDDAVKSFNKNVKVQRTPAGKDSVQSHPCTKEQITLTDDQGRKEQITSWEASDLKNFPVQAQLFEAGQDIMLKFRNVKLGAPDAKIFDAPTGYKKYTDVQALMTGAAMNAVGQ